MKQRVISIELYDAGVILLDPDCEDMFARFEVKRKFIMSGKAIRDLAEHFYLDFRPYLMKMNIVAGRDEAEHLEDLEITVEEEMIRFEMGNLLRIEAEIIASNLLEFDIVFKGKEGEFSASHTYNGTFTVLWWTEDE